MSIKISCPRCEQEYSVDPSLAGQIAKCDFCESNFEIPAVAVMPEPEKITPVTTTVPPPASENEAAITPPPEKTVTHQEAWFDRVLMWSTTFFMIVLIMVLLFCAFMAYASVGTKDIMQQIHGALSALVFLTMIVIILLVAIVVKIDVIKANR